MSTNDGGPAFPTSLQYSEWGERLDGQDTGMTLRDYFAAKAMQGLCAEFEKAKDGREIRAHYLAKRSYEIADAMLDARVAK